MTQLGLFHTLPIVRLTDFGAFLDAAELGEILLPRRYLTDDMQPGSFVRVFVHLDSEDRPVATTDTPKAQVGQFAFLKVVATNRVGAFLDWGLGKDLLVPFGEQYKPMEEGRSYLVYVFVNRQDGRILASSKLDRFLDKTPANYRPGQAVELMVANSTDLGFKVIVNHAHWGLLFAREAPASLRFGQSLKGFVKRVRPDGKIDVGLQSVGDRHDANTGKLLAALAAGQGFLALHDKSSPAEIERALGMSKAAFKRAVGGLLSQGEIELTQAGIRKL